MRYLLVNAFDEPVRAYHRNLVEEVVKKFPTLTWTKEQGLPAHFTLKYSFEAVDISELEDALARLAGSHFAAPVRVGEFGCFEDQVVFAAVDGSQDAKILFTELINELSKISWMQWSEFDGPSLRFHMTIAQKCGKLCQEVLHFLEGKNRRFDVNFNNITIFRQDTAAGGVKPWKLYKRFELR